MAIDATGAPTSPDSIPTYNTAADNPSGKGLNNIVAAIQTALSNRLKLNSAPSSTGQVPVWNNATSHWDPGTVAAGPGAPATTLPGSPTDGQQAILTDSTTVPTYAWLFQWSTTASKWFFIGGSPAESHVDTSENVNSVTYVDLATVGPQFTLPRAGDYILHFGAKIQFASATNNTMFVSPKLGAAATADADGATILNNGITGGMLATISRTRKATGLAASAVIKLQYRQSTAAAQAIQDRWLTVLPVAVT